MRHFRLNPIKHEIIVNGYYRKHANKYIPTIIRDITIIFYDDTALFHVFNSISGQNIICKAQYAFKSQLSIYFIKNHNLYVYGDNIYSQSGMKNMGIDTSFLSTTKNEFFHDKDIHLISNGVSGYHCFVCTKNDHLYGFGYNDSNQLGTANNDANGCVISPTLISYKFDSKLKQMECGRSHTLFLTQTGNVYGSGRVLVGLKHTIKYKTSKYLIQRIISTNNIKSIKCGQWSSYLVYNNNIVKSCGDNRYGQLGIQEPVGSKDEFTPVLDASALKAFDAGAFHIGCLNEASFALYMYGNNRNGQCGQDFVLHCHKRKTVTINNDFIVDVKCGHSHTIIKTNKNHYYSFGNNKNNQLIINKKVDFERKPQLISFDYIKKLTKCNHKIIDFICNQYTYIIQEYSL